MVKEDKLRILKKIKKEIKQKYKAYIKGVFGSFVKGKEKDINDIDILVDFEKGADLFDFLGLTLFLEEKLNCRVDLVPEKSIRKELREPILREVVYL